MMLRPDTGSDTRGSHPDIYPDNYIDIYKEKSIK